MVASEAGSQHRVGEMAALGVQATIFRERETRPAKRTTFIVDPNI